MNTTSRAMRPSNTLWYIVLLSAGPESKKLIAVVRPQGYKPNARAASPRILDHDFENYIPANTRKCHHFALVLGYQRTTGFFQSVPRRTRLRSSDPMPTVQVLEEAAVPVWIRTTTPCQVAGEVVFAQGCSIHKWLPVASEYCMNSAGNHGVDIDWYAGDKFHGKPVVTRQRNITDLFLWDSAPIENVGPEWSAIVKTSLMPTVSGKHSISFMSAKLFE